MEIFLLYLTFCFIFTNIQLVRINYKDILRLFNSNLTIKKFLYRFSIGAFWYIFICALFPFIWPILIALSVQNYLDDKKIKEEEEKSKFRIESKDLIKKLDRKEIESKEIVHDPLEAVPPLPFGHLHNAWLTYCKQIEAEDELWSFSAAWTNRWDSKEQIEGYVAVRKGAIGPYFRTH